jgi:DNA-binding SARP family transcriptional activator
MARRTIRLLGEPAILDPAGQPQEVRGYKAWGVLARAVLARGPLGRQMLVTELFSEADDPLGSLRWCLASLRKALDAPDCLRGDPLVLNLPATVEVDVLCLDRDEFDIEQAGGLLDGIEPQASPEFSTWLLVERERMASVVASRLRQETIRAISTENHDRAIRLAELCVRRAPFNEGAHVLLVKSLANAGHYEAALRHVEATEMLFLTELGEKPSLALRSAARRTVASAPAGISRTAFVHSLIESGLAALSAGAPDAGVDCLRRAVHDAEEVEDAYLLPKALLELGTALVHFARGYADEGSIFLRQATDLARQRGYASIAANSLRELGFLEGKVGRRPTAAAYLSNALEFAEDSDTLAGIHAVMGLNLVDWGRINEGLEHFTISLEHARAKRAYRREIFSLGLGARGLLAADRLKEADDWLERCLVLVEEQRWIAFRPWPIALLSESRIRQQHDPGILRPRLEEAFALSCQLSDPCWEAAVARAIALTYAAEMELASAMEWLAEARRRCVRETNRYVALQVEVLANQTEISLKQGQGALADAFAREWLSLAARTHMDAHVARAAGLITRVGPRNRMEEIETARI